MSPGFYILLIGVPGALLTLAWFLSHEIGPWSWAVAAALIIGYLLWVLKVIADGMSR